VADLVFAVEQEGRRRLPLLPSGVAECCPCLEYIKVTRGACLAEATESLPHCDVDED
jgi:hypothetical protein